MGTLERLVDRVMGRLGLYGDVRRAAILGVVFGLVLLVSVTLACLALGLIQSLR